MRLQTSMPQERSSYLSSDQGHLRDRGSSMPYGRSAPASGHLRNTIPRYSSVAHEDPSTSLTTAGPSIKEGELAHKKQPPQRTLM
jgi:hypothetical protein